MSGIIKSYPNFHSRYGYVHIFLQDIRKTVRFKYSCDYIPSLFFGANHFQFDFPVGGTKQPYAVAEKNRYDSQMISVYHIT